MIGNRNEDLSKVFDRTWQANHNDVAKRGRQDEKNFMNKMFNVPQSNKNIKFLTPREKAEQLHKNMNNAFQGQRNTNLNNIIKKWK